MGITIGGVEVELRTKAFIGGNFVDAADGTTFETYAPSTGQVLANVAACGELDVDRAVQTARAAFDAGVWSRIAPADRKTIMLRFADIVERELEPLAHLEALDAGKPIADCLGVDLPEVVKTIRWYAEAADKVFGKTAPTGETAFSVIVKEPIGVVGAVLPWNFPLLMLAWKIAPALIAGNSVVVKPPELASLTTIRMAELAVEAGIPSGVFNVVPGLGHVAGKALGLHMDVDAVAFTGSTEIGREFLRYSAASNLKNVVLECGGKSPQIVMRDCADRLDTVAADLASAAFWNSGQNCSAGSRILVDNKIRKELVSALVRHAQSRTMGDPIDEATVLGPLIEPAAMEKVLGYIESARSAKATIACGGERILEDTGGWYVGATVIDDVTPDMAVAREEIFGPVVSVLGFDTEDEAIALANDTEYGLAATVWSRNIDVALRMARGVRAGTVAVNGYAEGDITTPFGGYRMSGFGGRDKGLEAIEQYTETKTIWITIHDERGA